MGQGGTGAAVMVVVVGFARRPGQYFKQLDVQKKLTRYARARAFSPFEKQPFRPRARLASRRIPPRKEEDEI